MKTWGRVVEACRLRKEVIISELLYGFMVRKSSTEMNVCCETGIEKIQMSFTESLWIQRKYKIACQEEVNEK